MHSIIYFLSLSCIFSFKPICSNIHEFMTEEEKIQTFDFFNSNGTIPDYELVRIWYQKPAGFEDDTLRMIVGNSNTQKTIDLKPVQYSVVGTLTPIWMASWIKDHMEFRRLPEITMGKEIGIYQTSENTIVGSGYDENGVKYFVGYIGDLTISPLVKSVLQKVHRLKRNVEPFLESEDSNKNYILSDYHILYTSSKFTKDNLRAYAAATKKKVEEQENVNISRKSKRQVFLPVNNITIYPEILLYTDYGAQFVEPRGLLFNRFLIYLIAFWNSVNMFYKSLENPRISLRVTGIVIGTTPYDCPFLKEATNFQNMVYDTQALTYMSTFFEEHKSTFPRSMYDIAITMTKRHICIRIPNLKACKNGTLGITKIRAVCEDDYNSGVSMVGIIYDELNFHGIIPAAHELAHIMGVTHDGRKRRLSPYCDTLDVNYNYIMSGKLYDVNLPFVWSNCSRETLTTYLAENYTECLREEKMAFNGFPTINILPGQIINAEQQCIQREYPRACDTQPSICIQLKCYKENSTQLFSNWKCQDSGPALDGTICGPEKICNARQCVNSPEKKSSFMSFLLG